jgi:hypothetical protein
MLLPINIAPSTVAGRACDAGRDMMAATEAGDANNVGSAQQFSVETEVGALKCRLGHAHLGQGKRRERREVRLGARGSG